MLPLYCSKRVHMLIFGSSLLPFRHSHQVLDMLLWLHSLSSSVTRQYWWGLWTPISHNLYQASVLRSTRKSEHSSLVRDILNMGPLGPIVLKVPHAGSPAKGFWNLNTVPAFLSHSSQRAEQIADFSWGETKYFCLHSTSLGMDAWRQLAASLLVRVNLHKNSVSKII